MEAPATYGYTGNVLRVNLSNGKITVENPDELFYRKYLGGAGFIAYYLLKELEPGIDPLGEQNKLIFAAGPLTGAPVGGSGRHCVGAKSPRSGALAKAEVGGYWGAELKRAGFDAIIIEGKAARPAYLWLHDGEAEIKDASHLWGKKTKDCQETIRTELGDSLIRVALIGPAGEKLVSFACVVNDLHDAAARTGMGAVMGSKNLKAIAVRGRKSVPIADPDALKVVAKWLASSYKQESRMFTEYGTGADMARGVETGNLPIRNFRDGDFEDIKKISAETLKERGLRISMESCWACPIACKKVVEIKEPYKVDPAYGGPEYETLGSLGSTCGVSDLEAVCKANELCNAYSMDTISTGVTNAFAMECFENGLLTVEDTGGIELTFGNAEAMVKLTEMIGERQGIGNLLAEGSAKAAQKIGRGAEAFAMNVKGVEVPMHEPRYQRAMGVLYAVNAYGADHTVGIYEMRDQDEGRYRVFGVLKTPPREDIGPVKVFVAKTMHEWRYFTDSLLLCSFTPYSYQQIVEMTAAVTGWKTSIMELLRIGERAVTMARVFNLREGFTSADDTLPKRYFQPRTSGALSKTALDAKKFDEARKYFYQLMGWDSTTGVPAKEKLEELEVGWLAEELVKSGVKL